MSLFSDFNCTHERFITSLDPEAAAVLRTSHPKQSDSAIISLDQICSRAWAEARSKLEAALQCFSLYVGTAGSEAHISAVLNTGLWGFGTRARIILSQLIDSDSLYSDSISPLQQWVTYLALRLIFQTAADRLDKNDRYARKEERYAKRAKELWSQLLSQGLSFTNSYFDCPGSLHGWQAGIWDTTCLSLSADPNNTNANDMDVRVAITYVDNTVYVSPTNKQNGESGPSKIVATTIPAGQLLTVSIASLNPPSANNVPNVGLSQGIVPRNLASHWQIYAGTGVEGSPLYLQVPMIPVGTTAAALPATLRLSGPQLDNGQVPSAQGQLIFGNLIVRG